MVCERALKRRLFPIGMKCLGCVVNSLSGLECRLVCERVLRRLFPTRMNCLGYRRGVVNSLSGLESHMECMMAGTGTIAGIAGMEEMNRFPSLGGLLCGVWPLLDKSSGLEELLAALVMLTMLATLTALVPGGGLEPWSLE